MTEDRKGNQAWARLLQELQIDLATATYPIELRMADLAKHGGREPRLMISMDTRSKCPKALADHGVFPLSVSTDALVLVQGDGWFTFPPPPAERRIFKARLPLSVAAGMMGKGENAHIMRLHTSGFLNGFLDASETTPCDSGKAMTPKFTVKINGVAIEVAGAQYEVDIGYATEDDLVPVEMKTKHYESCAIRQVYYPYRSWGEKIRWTKSVRPLYITFDEMSDDYIVRELGFRGRDVWQSIYEVKQDSFRMEIEEPKANLLDLSAPELPEERIPQADRIARIAEFPIAVARGVSDSAVISDFFGVHIRQSSYYRDAVQSLGLVRLNERKYELTADGQRYIDLAPQAQADWLARRISRLPVIRAVLAELERRGAKGMPVSEISDVLLQFARDRRQALNHTTADRRRSTIRAYLDYIGSRTGSVVKGNGSYFLREHLVNLDDFS